MSEIWEAGQFGQVYSTLARLQRDGLADAVGVAAGAGPERKLYAITGAGVSALEDWLDEPELIRPGLRNEVFTKVVLALVSGRSAGDVLDRQRAAHLARMRELTAMRSGEDVVHQLTHDFEILHLEADLKWIELAGQRVIALGRQVRR